MVGARTGDRVGAREKGEGEGEGENGENQEQFKKT
jgi:hypothetical protein